MQADVRQLLLSGDLGLGDHDLEVELESPLGDRRRIDVEVGCTVIEVKKDLRKASVIKVVQDQLAGYVAMRAAQTGQRYVGVLTDGREWRAYHERNGKLVEVTQHVVNPTRPDSTALLYWLEGVLASRQGVPPRPSEIIARLGATSASYALDRATLTALYADHGSHATVRFKRQLWSRLLRSALGTQFTDDDELFLEHTLLVNSAEIIAHLVVGLDVIDMQPASLLGGQRFDLAAIYGVVEHDFFDWVLEVPSGGDFVRTLARRLSRFDWTNVEHDVLKVLYESIIGSETRKQLGEYYTPDWLAEQVVSTAVTDPLNQRVLDPACGSGTFLFHAVRGYLDAAAAAGISLAHSLSGLTDHVLGVDLHPVAVTLARVTYLLAIGRERLLAPDRGAITVPVYLGDSMQWNQRRDLFTEGHLVVATGRGDQLFDAEFRFPDRFLADAARFDRLVSALADHAAKQVTPGRNTALPVGLLHRLAVSEEDRPAVEENYRLLCQLNDEGRDHVWSYYIRNLARPAWLARPENRVDVLIGNPPWLSYRYMTEDMQAIFREMSEARGLWHGREVATHQDLSALFVARTTQQYLTDGGSFAFVMPNAVLDRGYYAGFRTGNYPDQKHPIAVEFTGSWDLRRLRPHFFPRGAAVVFGKRSSTQFGSPLPARTTRWTGQLPRGTDAWDVVSKHVYRHNTDLSVHNDTLAESPYEPRFSQGATIVPRVLFMVDTLDSGPLGLAAGRKNVRSARSSTEKMPWKELRSLEAVVEAEFIRPILLGESVLPFRVLPAKHGIIPLEGTKLLDGEHPHLDRYPGLADWWRKVEQLWLYHRSSDRLTLREQLDFRNKLTNQLPTPPLRVVYGASGMHVVAALVEDPTVICEHSIYWGAVASPAEGNFLCAIFNTPSLTNIVRPLMSYGKDERHIDKHVWKLPIPLFDSNNPTHRELSDLGAKCADVVAGLDLGNSSNFVALRRRVRSALAADPTATKINEVVLDLLRG